MKAIVASSTGPMLAEVPVPDMGPADVLVRVRAAGLNRAELAMARGASHGDRGGLGLVLGLEWSGVVERVGADVAEFRPGDRVMCTGSGGWAERAVTDRGRTLPVPAELDDVAAATLPTALQTAHNALATLARLDRGESVLVHGASSGVGLMAIQVAREMGAGTVIATSRDEAKRSRLAVFGADVTVDSGRDGWADDVLAATGGRGAAVVLDLVSGPGINETMRATALLGRLVGNGRLGGNLCPFDFDLHQSRRITYIGSSFRTRTKEEVRAITARMQAELWPALIAGRLRMPVFRTFPLAEAALAQDVMRADRHFGKLVLLGEGASAADAEQTV